MNDIVLNNMVFSAGTPQVGDRCLIIQSGNDKYCVPMKLVLPEFFKCASINTETHKWSGYKAILTNGIYSFSDTLTNDLPYGDGFTPVVNEIYDRNALIHVADLYTGN